MAGADVDEVDAKPAETSLRGEDGRDAVEFAVMSSLLGMVCPLLGFRKWDAAGRARAGHVLGPRVGLGPAMFMMDDRTDRAFLS